MTATASAAPDPDDGDQAADHHLEHQGEASPGRDNPPIGTPAGTSVPTSAPSAAARPVSPGQPSRTRGLGRGDNPLLLAADVRWKRGSTSSVRAGVLVALALFQRCTAREIWFLACAGQRCDRAVRDALLDLRDAGRVREELRLPDGRKLWCLTAAGRREAAALLPAGAKLSALRPEREGSAAAFSEHALDVAAVAGLLAKSGIGRLGAFSTEVEHALPGRRSLFTDLVLRDPGTQVPLLLVEVDRENESIGTLVDKLTSYRTWCELPAKGATKAAFEKALGRGGARTHDLRLWSALYPATGREGLPPVALVFEAGRKRTRRPGTAALTPQEKKEKANTDHQRLLRRAQAVEAASETAWCAPPYWWQATTARDYHRVLPVVATTLPLLRARGADAPIWRRFGRPGWHTLTGALDNPDGDRLLEAEEAAHDQVRQRKWEAAERERRRPACTRCKAKFTDGWWAEYEAADTWSDDGLCAGCRQADADQKALDAAERERAAAEAAAAEAKRIRSWWRRP